MSCSVLPKGPFDRDFMTSPNRDIEPPWLWLPLTLMTLQVPTPPPMTTLTEHPTFALW